MAHDRADTQSIGINCVAWSLEEAFFECHAQTSSMEEILYTLSKRSFAVGSAPKVSINETYVVQLALRGRYDQAILILEDVDQASLRTIKHQQYWMTCLRLLKLQRSLRR